MVCYSAITHTHAIKNKKKEVRRAVMVKVCKASSIASAPAPTNRAKTEKELGEKTTSR